MLMTSAYQLERISYRYKNISALHIERLEIKADAVTALTGPNGSGKSTLLNLLAFLNYPSQGEMRFFNTYVTYGQLAFLRDKVGYLPQKPYLLRGTVLDNLLVALKLAGFPKAQRKNTAMAALQRLNIQQYAEQNIKQLSGGARQKVALARTLARQPEVLILDEPFNNLDQSSTRLLEAFIESYQQTLIFSTHNTFQGLALSNQVISLANGEQVKTPQVNLFQGKILQHNFATGKITITLPGEYVEGHHASIDPGAIVLSKEPLSSHISNAYQGRIIAIAEENGNVRVDIDAKERFQALITYQVLHELELHLGDCIWVNFNSNSVLIC
jgi:tungstate transport system ATP-binding protein